ncbi:pyridoxine/pyridoxamine 5'-phosphate oxidase 1, chloroplastic-like [Primulina huaijiensis]|uniref:pyridoxine/pyridoxamine 5'-phosphate oxidase 1, chloroplastic-like n=1 Tax=Primulina huaijiensis TaxID=1492673 RepID=UPI003CC7829D
MPSIHHLESMSRLTQKQAAEIEELLVGRHGFCLDQLMIYKSSEYTRVLATCGPGDNAGKGLPAARHLHHFGRKLQGCYPNPLYMDLVTQLESLVL